jgi:hypothetical protein
MTGHHHPHATYYPQTPNQIEADPTPKDQAVYIPSVTPGFAMAIYAGQFKRALPNGLAENALNFLDPANRDFFHISHVMSSAGQALNQPRDCIITQRDRKATRLIADSGGWQIAADKGRIDPYKERGNILRWMERHADYAMTLDVPTGPVGKRSYRYTSFRDCLDHTLDHVDFFQRERTSPDLKLLNVLQGNNRHDADVWYDAVKGYRFEGFAFAGPLRRDLYEVCRRIIRMADEGQLQDKVWLHFLGTADLETAVLLTALQRTINASITDKLRISFDTSTPFSMLGRCAAYTLPKLGDNSMSMGEATILNNHRYVGNPLPWPWPSPLGNMMTLADVCVDRDVTIDTAHDSLSNHLVAHHSLSALCWAVALVNRVFSAEGVGQDHSIASHVGAAIEVINEVIQTGTEFSLAKNRGTFSHLRYYSNQEAGKQSTDIDGEDERPTF